MAVWNYSVVTGSSVQLRISRPGIVFRYVRVGDQ
jgi:hypothetical protein